MSAATLKPIRLECYLHRLSGANKVSLFRADSLARYLLQCAQDSSVVSMDTTYLTELVTDMRPLWDQTEKITITEISSQNFGTKQERN